MDTTSRVINKVERDSSRESLEDSLTMLSDMPESEWSQTAERLVAEIAYLLALDYKREEDTEKSEEYARLSIRRIEGVDTSTLRHSLPILSEHLPEFFHEGVVRSRVLGEGHAPAQ